KWKTEITRRKAPLVLTPHPKEAARLLGAGVADVQSDRFEAARKMAEEWNAIVVLKGPGTLVAQKGHPTIAVATGYAGLAKGGSGGVLSGILAGLLASNVPVRQAVPFGIFIHGLASEKITYRWKHTRSTLATD